MRQHLRETFPAARIIILHLETDSLASIIYVMTKTNVLIAMHGSSLILGGFLPKDGRRLIVECFPYGIRSEAIAPYKTMAGLHGMNIKYVAWEVDREISPYSAIFSRRLIYHLHFPLE